MEFALAPCWFTQYSTGNSTGSNGDDVSMMKRLVGSTLESAKTKMNN